MPHGSPVLPGAQPDAVATKSDAAVVRDALGVGIAVGLSGFAFGVTSAGSGLSLLQTCALSLAVFTGASQFALVGALAAGGNPYTAAAGAFFLGVRNSFYGLRLSQLLALPRTLRPFAAQWVIDETTAVTLPQPTRRAARIGFAVTGLTLYVLWNLTTLLGALGAKALGDTDAWGLDAASPAVFLALLAPMLKSTTERITAAVAVLLALGLLPVLPAGVPVLLSALAAPAVLFLGGRRSGTNGSTTTTRTITTDLSATDLSATDLSATDLSATDLSATDPSTTDPSTTDPSTTDPSTGETTTTDTTRLEDNR
ncbi:AzlC family ABC transporter permease [Streptomyces sp. NPDC047515]|uniref:AzlC family ABC transporter permease n=1 Tax=Streptomyces sp. NPDC047515 TaxID=3155380 RepID=UPI003403417F